jgi:hypothetical protein
VEDINIWDVSHALGNKCRFTGHTRKFYSTGEHSYRISKYLESIGASLMDQYVGLHHDDTDAYLPDVPTPLKVLPEFEFFKKVESHLQKLCYQRFDCIVNDYSIVKRADIIALLTEKRDLMPQRNSDWNHKYTETAIPEPYYIEPWTPSFAKLMFQKRHFELRRKLNL